MNVRGDFLQLAARRLIALLLVFQFTFPFSHPAHAVDPPPASPTLVDQSIREGQEIIANDPDARAHSERLLAVGEQFENASETEPPRGTTDAYRLVQQSAVFYRLDGPDFVEEFAMGRHNRDLPAIVISDFESEVRIEADVQARTLRFTKHRGPHIEAEHIIHDVTPIAVTHDIDLLQFVDASGKIYAIDMLLARSLMFKTSIPIFEIAQAPPSVAQAFRDGREVQVRFLHRSLRELADMNISPDALVPHEVLAGFEPGLARQSLYRLLRHEQVLVAGDLVITSTDPATQRQELHGIYDRGVTLTQVFTGEGLLAIATHASAHESSAAANRAIRQLLNDPRLVEAIRQQERALQPSPEAIEALRTFEPVHQMRIAVRASANREPRRPADTFLLRELEVLDSQNSNTELQPAKSPLLSRLRFHATSLSPKKVRRFAMLTALGLGTAGFAAGVNDIGPAWAVHLANETWANYAPEVLRSAAHRMTVLKGTLSLLAIVPVSKAIYALAGKTLRNWSWLRTYATVAARVQAATELPFLTGLAWLTRQPNFVHAASNGLNPLTTPGALNSPIAGHVQLQANRTHINERADQHDRVRAMAWALAMGAVGQRAGIEPATLAALQNGDIRSLVDTDLITKLNDPVFRREHLRLARELYFVYREVPAAQNELSKVSTQEWEQLYAQASEIAERFANHTDLQRVEADLNVRAREALHSGVWSTIGNAGQDIYHYHMNVDPTLHVQKISWDRYQIDYIMTVIQTAFTGPRADISAPEDLAAMEGQLLNTNPTYLSETFDGLYGYIFRTPALNTLVFQRDQEPEETTYHPIEDTALVPTQREQSFFEGLRAWVAGASNLREAQYGYLAWKNLTSRMRSAQSLIATEVFFRVALGNQSVAEAIPSTLFMFVFSYWVFCWQWDPVVRGNEISERTFNARVEAYNEAKRKLGQGIRLSDAALTREGIFEMNRLYAEHSSEVHPELLAALRQAEELLQIPAPELEARRTRLFQYTALLVQLQEMIRKGNREEIREAHENLSALYRGERIALEDIDAEVFLNYALTHPPVAIVADGLAPKLPFLLGSIVTTYAYTAIGVLSYHGISWAQVGLYSALSAVFYGIAHGGQTALNSWMERWKTSHTPERLALPSETSSAVPVTPPLSICELQMLPESQRPIVVRGGE